MLSQACTVTIFSSCLFWGLVASGFLFSI
uniref:Uncharacterized protein n=1 Tax=Anguilla anguilla TaxID=7936 RepID=A0A0E9SHI3_ANGAN